MVGETGSVDILHVDDDPDFVDLAADMLEREDDRFAVQVATSADAGLDRLEAAEFDCIVSDYDMPRKTGLEFLQDVREDHPDLPFILFTGKGSEEVASDAISEGVTDYLQKGHGLEQYTILANRIVNAVSQRWAERAVERTREYFETILSHSSDYVLIVDEEGRVEFASQAVEEIMGFAPDELEGADAFEFIHPDDLSIAAEAFSDLRESPDDERAAEYRARHADGSWRWIEVRGRNLLDDPTIEGILVNARDITERKERERQLTRIERRYRAIFDDPNILVGLIDTDGTVLDINQTALEYVDTPIEELEGTRFWETQWFEHSEAIQAAVRDWIDRASSGEYVEFEADLERPDGDPYAVEGVFRPVTDENGEVVSLIISDREITARRERERELERIQDLFRGAEQLGNLGAWEFRADGDVVWTEGTRRIHEVDQDYEPTIESGIEFYHPGDRGDVERAVEAALEAGEPYDVEARLITADGNERWVRTRGRSVDDGQLVRGYMQDITAQKEREEALTRAKSQLESAVDAGAVGTWEWHVQEDTLITDPSFAETFGVDPRDARAGVPLERFTQSIHDDDVDRVEHRIDEALENCADYEAEYRVWNEDDELRWVTARGTVECDERGVPRTFPGALIDITERKRAEEELKRRNERLDEFASIVSHDLRNPLNVAANRVALARGECESEHLDAVDRALDRMDRLIEDLLELSRTRSSTPELEPVDVESVIEDCWNGIDASEATLSASIESKIEADRGWLRQLVDNLLRNAIDHGGQDVSIVIGELDDGFFVEDDGPGIERGERADVFSAGHSSKADGTGFGLSIVEQVADSHGWQLQVTDGSEGGARFEITGVTLVEG